jgi:glutathione synthase/RimK-type ligase-like ATP-grasp enzyme
MPGIHLAEIDLVSILSSVHIGRMPALAIPELIVKAHDDPDPANIFMQMFYILQALGQHESALGMQTKALERRCLYRIIGPPTPAIRLLALMGPGDRMENAPLEFVVENSDIRLDLMFLLPDQALPQVIPDHDVAIVTLSESDKNRPLLARMEVLLADWPRPVLNHPQHIVRCARDAASQLLSDIPGLLIPRTRRFGRQQISRSTFPITIRPIDTHGGKGLAKLDTVVDLDAYLAINPDARFFVAEYVDYRGDDGLYRKARIALIDGKPYVCHLAISEDWMVHYISAGMHLSELKRAEEAAMMESFDRDFADRHRAAFQGIAERLGLDYVILDCGETRDGRLVLFEADVGGWIHATDPVDIFPYKPPVMQKAFDAFRTMLMNRSASRFTDCSPQS